MCHIVKLVCLTVLLLVTVQSLRDDHYFYEMSPLTELGRYLNQSETDFETKMKPVCSCQSLPFRTNYTDEYCYCTLGCPIPEHPFTQELLLPSESVKCFRNVTTPLEMKGRVRSKPLFPYFCHRPEQIMDGSARWFAFLCIHDFSLNHVRHFFDINPGWSSKLEKEEKRHEKYGWRNDNKEQNQPPESERESRRGNGRNVNALDLLTSLDAKEEVKIPSGIQVLGNINFTMEQENEAFHLIRVLTPINFTISGE
ncbi:hypothetical protein Fcan01_06293 [Folsomia candida]|uniref:Uncharacterized protein n=1 Tax=Folsomia candida TaxID=158441 RepID=A0A226ETE2_FOLCA|nr:hypothetical protein Fcan01_06293 [Folsomia candida]